MSGQAASRLRQPSRSASLGAAVLMFVVAAAFHYPEQLLPFLSVENSGSLLGMEGHAIERIGMLVPIAFVGFAFGMRAGVVACAVALAIMLPRSVFLSEDRADALVGTSATILAGGLISLWIDHDRRERWHRVELRSSLEEAQEQLHGQLRILRIKETQLAAVDAISRIVSQSLNRREILCRAADKLMEVADLEAVLVFMLDEERDELVLDTHRGIPEDVARSMRTSPWDEDFNSVVLETGKPLALGNACRAPTLKDAPASGDRIKAQLIAPLKAKGKALGTVWAARRGSRRFEPEEVDLLCAGYNVIAIAIENARLYEEERLMAEQLRVSERRYRDLFEGAEEPMWVENRSGEITMANEACAKLFGRPVAQLTGRNIAEFVSGNGLRRGFEIRKSLLKGGSPHRSYEQRVARSDGSEVLLRISITAVSGNSRSEAFQLIGRDITEERRGVENLRVYLHHIAQGQEEERRRIARELHDDTAQELVALSRQLDSFTSARRHLPEQDVQLLEGMLTRVDEILGGVRRFSQDLRPSVLDDLGLLPALEWLVCELREQFDILIGLAVVGPHRRFQPDVELMLFRVAQEALRNVWKHSEASRAWVTLEFSEGKTILCVRDNGKGFKVPRNMVDLAAAGKLGLAGMAERVRLVGGKLMIDSKLGEGTTVTAEIQDSADDGRSGQW